MDEKFRISTSLRIPLEYRRRGEASEFAHKIYPMISDGGIYEIQVSRRIEGDGNISTPYYQDVREVTDIRVTRAEVRKQAVLVPDIQEFFVAEKKTFRQRLKYLFFPNSF